MKILVINCGSSSLKYQVFDMDNESVLAKGLVERIGIDGSRLKHTKIGMDAVVTETAIPDHKVAVDLVLKSLLDAKVGVLKSLDELGAVGHRVVHGGEEFASSVKITPAVMNALKRCAPLAPLHNPANIIGIEAITAALPRCLRSAFSTRRSIRPCPITLFAMPCPRNITRKTTCAATAFTAPATASCRPAAPRSSAAPSKS